MSKSLEHRIVNRQIRRAQAYVLWGTTGIFFPILGLVFGVAAVHKTRIVEEDYDMDLEQEDRLPDIRTQGYIIIGVAIVSAVVWALVFNSTR